jgi:hypothetical protein
MFLKRNAALQILILLVPPLVIMWVDPLLIPHRADRYALDGALSLLTLAIAVTVNILNREGPRDVGLRIDNFGTALLRVAWFTAISSAVLIGLGWFLGSINLGERFTRQLTVLPLWGFLQNYGLQGVVNRRSQQILGPGRRSVLLTAAIFAALHLPNPVLVAATFVAGYFWAAAFQSAPNLLALALSHAWLSTLLANSLPHQILPNMKVGWGFW